MFHVTMHETSAGRPALSRQFWLPKKPVMRRCYSRQKKICPLPPLDILGPRASKEKRRDQSSSSRTSHLAAVGTNRPLFPLLLGNCPHGLRRRNREGEEEEEQRQRYLECCRRNPLHTSSQAKEKNSVLKEGTVRPLKTATTAASRLNIRCIFHSTKTVYLHVGCDWQKRSFARCVFFFRRRKKGPHFIRHQSRSLLHAPNRLPHCPG